MFLIVRCAFLICTVAAISGCNEPVDQKVTVDPRASSAGDRFTGYYADQGYAQKDKGADWVAVTITSVNDTTWQAAVRSRADLKKPTCRFDARLVKRDDSTLVATQDGKQILFRFTDSSLQIAPEQAEEKSRLAYYCSGGASLAGVYHQITGLPDQVQIDQKVFSKILSLQQISFDVWSTPEKKLYIQPVGLRIDNRPIILTMKDTILDAEIEDVNADGYPELMIYTRTSGKLPEAGLVGVSVNHGKSVSLFAFPEKDRNSKAFAGYRGGDELAMIENRLVLRFRVYAPADADNHPTGPYRQISYHLVNGEAMRIWVVDKITEFPAN